MAIFGKKWSNWTYIAKKWSNWTYIAITFRNTCPKWTKIVFLDSSYHVLSKNINFI